MSSFQLSDLRNSTVWAVYRLKDKIWINPPYQRDGDIWTEEKRQLLIDTIINQFDVPKIYLHKFTTLPEGAPEGCEYAVLDGKQRLAAIWGFIDGDFALSGDFEYLRETKEPVDIVNKKYADIARENPLIKTDFDSYLLDIVCMETDELELIEDLFSRLNEAVPLNAPEKRNAKPGPLPPAVRALSLHPFFTQNLPFSNRRYRHFDVASKMIMIISRSGEVTDTKKAYIDRFFENGPKHGEAVVTGWADKARKVLDAMASAFTQSDKLLRQVGMVTLYFHLFARQMDQGANVQITRAQLQAFDDKRVTNRQAAEKNLPEADYNLLEFDRYTQSPNDGIAMRFRLGVIDKQLFSGALGFAKDDQTPIAE